MDNVRLLDIINVETMQKMQDNFSKYANLAVCVTDINGVPVTEVTGGTGLCMQLTRQTKLGCQFCQLCERTGIESVKKEKHAVVYECHSGLLEFVAPIRLNGESIGYIVGGQVRATEVNDRNCRRLAIKYGIDSEEFKSAAENVKLMCREELEKTAHFVETFALHITEFSYSKYLMTTAFTANYGTITNKGNIIKG